MEGLVDGIKHLFWLKSDDSHRYHYVTRHSAAHQQHYKEYEGPA